MPGIAAVLALFLPFASVYGDTLEDAVKATYLYKFVPFVEWPATAHESPSSPVDLCVMGDGRLAGVLEQAVQDQRLGARPFAVRQLRSVEGDARCHVLYLAGLDVPATLKALASVRGRPVLTVTDEAATPWAKGIVNFVIRDGRVRFEIDTWAAAENGIEISSKLLSLAVSVQGQS